MAINKNVWDQIEAWKTKKRETTAHRIARKADQKPCLTAKDLQDDSADSRVVALCSTMQQDLHKYDLQ